MTVQRWDKVWREEFYTEVKDIEGPFVHYSDYAKLERKVKRLEKRLLTKQKYETEMLVQSGATPRYIHEIHERDEKAIKGE